MKKAIFTFMAMLLVTLAAQAATSYGFSIGGVEVTSNNCNNVTGGDIYGQVTYNPSTKTLTLTDVFIYRDSGSENYALHNRSCDGLIVKLIGQNYLVSNNANAIRIDNNVGMTIRVEGGAYNSIQSNSTDAIFAQADSRYQLYFTGSGYVRINAPTGYGLKSNNDIHCSFGGSAKTLEVEIIGAKGAVNWYYQMTFGDNCIVSMKATGNSSYPIITCGQLGCFDASASNLLYARIDRPLGAEVNYARTTIIKNGFPVYNEDIVIVSKNLNYSVGINLTNFPDGNFRNHLLSLYPKRYLTQSDINNLTSLDCSSKYISSLQGIEIFTALRDLRCSNNRLSSLDLSNNTALTYLDCSQNSLTALRLYDHTRLKTLYCNNNKLTFLKLPPATDNALQTINCSNNEFSNLSISYYSNLSSLDVSNNPLMTRLTCTNNILNTFNVTNCPALTNLDCTGYQHTFTTLDLTGTTALTNLSCSSNPCLSNIPNLSSCIGMKWLACSYTQLTSLPVSSMNDLEELYCYETKITTLTLNNKSKLTFVMCDHNPNMTYFCACNNPVLETLYCNNCTALTDLHASSNNKLIELYVNGDTALTTLSCGNNPMLSSISGLSDCHALINLEIQRCNFSTLSLSGLINLDYLNCSNNKLTLLNTIGMTKLRLLDCHHNQLNTLNVRECSALESLSAGGNQLTVLNVQGCNSLCDMWVYANKFTAIGMSTLISSLPTRSHSSPGRLRVLDYVDSGDNEQNVILDSQIVDAANKFWHAMTWNGDEWVDLLSNQPGDVTGDGEFNITDATDLTQMLLNGDVSLSQYPAADYNGDGVVNISDVTDMISYLLNN